MTELELRHYRHDDIAAIRQTLLDVHAGIPEYSADDPFVERFPWFVDHWGSHPEFTCVIGYDGGEAVGFIYGAPQNPEREWWREHLAEVPEHSRTYAVSELMVRPEWRKTGAADQLHDALLEGRDEALAVLLVDVTHPRVQARYESWGYRKVGERQPFADSPRYAVMLLALRQRSASTT